MPKRILITGATRGLGRALALKFAQAGHTVAGCGRNGEQVAALARELGSSHLISSVDVGNDTEVARWIGDVVAKIGVPDLVLNNAAVMNTPAPLWKISASEFDSLVQANLNGTTNVIRHIVPALIGTGHGILVNFSSGWGRSTSPEVAPYCATKWAIEGLTQALAQELPKGLAAIALNPGIIDTEMLRRCWGDGAGEYPTPEAWAEKAAPYLLRLTAKDNGKALTVS